MRPRRRERLRAGLPPLHVAAACALALAGFAAVLATGSTRPRADAALAVRAAARMEAAERVLKEAILAEGIPVEAALDPNMTGLIGPEWTCLTTTLGDLEAKRTVLDPNFAAMMVRYFGEAGLRPGDIVAVGASGSFPGLALATLCAAREMGLEVLTIASFGASMYGATRPELTIPRMMRILAAAGLVPDSLIAVSPGGDLDAGGSALFEEAREVQDRLAREAGVECIRFDPPDLAASIARRLELYAERAGGRRIACFVNIGGASPNSGTSSRTLDFPQGLVLDPPPAPASADRGLVYEYAARGLPVINLLNVRLLARENGLPYDPIPLPRAGEGGAYRETRYEPGLVVLTLAASIGILAAGASRRRGPRGRDGAGGRLPSPKRPG